MIFDPNLAAVEAHLRREQLVTALRHSVAVTNLRRRRHSVVRPQGFEP